MARLDQDSTWRWLPRSKNGLNSIQAQMSLLAALIFLITWIGAAVISNTQGFRNSQAILEREAALVADILVASDGSNLTLPEVDTENSRHSLQVWDAGVLVSSIGPVSMDQLMGESAFSDTVNGETWVFAERCRGNTCVRYGAAHQRRHQNFRCLAASIFGPIFLILLFGFGLTVCAIRYSLRPLNDFAARVSTLDVENPSKLRTVGQQEEFSPLIEAVNSLGHRVRNLLERERVFLGTCAHEIRTPLAGLLGQLQLIDDDRQLDTARSCAERTARVADQFLTFAASKSLQSARLAEETFDVCEVVRDAIAPLVGNTNALVEMEGLDAQNVRAHSFAISAIASNLVQNALKYGKKDLNALYIRINLSILNNAISLSVEDNGNGLTDEEMKSAMQEFTRVGASASETGAGLGLSIVQEIAIQYGGSVELSRSADLKGLKIAVNLPILTDTVLPQSRPIVEQQYRSSEALLRSAEVLPMPN